MTSKPNNFFSMDGLASPLPHDNRPIPIGDFDYEDEIDECPTCGKSLAEHTRKERIKCALKRVEGVPHY